ncbi:hypothetical protein [Thalassolituus sp. C2-1]|nr:hypothetical protein [Thalassolituus sp. C2-1]TVV39509.1 hypothetical protein FOT50_19195 [Thalassolituus sp. C2-1]TVV39572.1 hypothetical protein FOT50_19190 [Thalassolituus sp. C2-1]
MTPLSDDELSYTTGQAFITVDASSYVDGANRYEFTKINLGLDIEIQSNIDELRLAEFDRTGDPDLADETQAADIIIKNFALGRVDDYDTSNPKIIPFLIKDPYIELAYKDDGAGGRQIAGFRLGFGQAKGDLSGDFQSLTGNMEGLITGSSSIAYDLNCSGPFSSTDCFSLWIAGDTQIEAVARLLDRDTGQAQLNGTYVKRASWLGIPQGESFSAPGGGIIGSLVPTLSRVDNCKSLGLDACFPVSIYQSFYVGDPSTDNFEAGSAKGIFMSLQSQAVPWQNYAGTGRIATDKGAFMNFSSYTDSNGQRRYPFVVDLYSALTGTTRVPTCIGQTKGC